MTPEQVKLSAKMTSNAKLLAVEEGRLKGAFREMASALENIREGELWRVHGTPHKNFGEYCRARFGFGPSMASQYITSKNTLLMLEEASPSTELVKIISALPEATIRKFTSMDPNKAIDVIFTITERGEPVNPSTISRQAKSSAPKPEKSKPKPELKPCPYCKHPLPRSFRHPEVGASCTPAIIERLIPRSTLDILPE